MSNQSSISLMSKFRGCLAGVLVGDCLGSPFEGNIVVPKVALQKFISKQLEEQSEKRKLYYLVLLNKLPSYINILISLIDLFTIINYIQYYSFSLFTINL